MVVLLRIDWVLSLHCSCTITADDDDGDGGGDTGGDRNAVVMSQVEWFKDGRQLLHSNVSTSISTSHHVDDNVDQKYLISYNETSCSSRLTVLHTGSFYALARIISSLC